MSPRREKLALGTVLTLIGMLAGAFLQWSATERRLSIHIATADDRVAMMCQLADYGAASDEYRNSVAEAHAAVEDRSADGKIVIDIAE